MWSLQKTKSGNAHVVENVYDIISGAAAQFDAGQFEHLTVLIKETWQVRWMRLLGCIMKIRQWLKGVQITDRCK